MRLRSKLLTMAGGSWPVLSWLRGKCRGVEIRRVDGGVELRKGDLAVLLAAKHAFFAPEVCGAFDVFAGGVPPVVTDGVSIADYAAWPDAFNLVRFSLRHGVRVESRCGNFWLRKDSRAMVLGPRHFVYAPDLAEKFELYYSPLVPEVVDGVEVLDYSRPGKLQTYRSSGLQFEMASFPEEEEAIEEYFKWYRPKLGDLVFDIGAHCGVSTYQLSKLVGNEGRVVAFEPDPVNYGILMRNIERHDLRNVVAQNVAIAGSGGKLEFNSEGTIGSGLVSQMQRDSVGSIVMVDAMTIADAFGRWGKPAFCKIDIEGAEIDVLKAAMRLLREDQTHFALDTNHPKENGEMTTRDVEALFRDCGYEVLSEANPLWTTWARPK